jgi:hypothetical protein
MPSPAHYRTRVVGTLLAAGAHAYLSLIGAMDLLNYTVPTRYVIVDQVASEHYWVWIHAIVAILLVAVLRRPMLRRTPESLPVASIACNIAFAMMFTWAFFNLLWGLSTVRPVSLAGPGLALVAAAGEQLLARRWARGTYDKGR